MSPSYELTESQRYSERIDDIPLLLAHIERMGLSDTLDAHLPPSGESGISSGMLAAVWITHLLSQSDQKQRHIANWAAARAETLRRCVRQPIAQTDLQASRLRNILTGLSHDAVWSAIEIDLSRQIIAQYSLNLDTIRITSRDESDWSLSPDGLIQIVNGRSGYSGGHQLHIEHALVEPLGLPIATSVSAHRSAIDAERTALIAHEVAGATPLHVVGHSAEREVVRASIQARGGVYLCELGARKTEAVAPIGATQREYARTPLSLWGMGGRQELIGEGYEYQVPIEVQLHGKELCWQERRFVIRSHSLLRQQEAQLRGRVGRARAELAALSTPRRGKRRPQTIEAFTPIIAEILAEHRVEALIDVSFDEQVTERMVRRYGGRPTGIRIARDVRVVPSVNERAVEQAVEDLGWQSFVTNMTGDLSIELSRALESLQPPSFAERVRGRAVSLPPGVLQYKEFAIGLVRLMSLMVRTLVLLDHLIDRNLRDETAARAAPDRLRGFGSVGERLLDAFRDVQLQGGANGGVVTTPLNALQRRALQMVLLPVETYHSL